MIKNVNLLLVSSAGNWWCNGWCHFFHLYGNVLNSPRLIENSVLVNGSELMVAFFFMGQVVPFVQLIETRVKVPHGESTQEHDSASCYFIQLAESCCCCLS